MKCQILSFWENLEKYFKLSSAEILHSIRSGKLGYTFEYSFLLKILSRFIFGFVVVFKLSVIILFLLLACQIYITIHLSLKNKDVEILL